MENVEYGHEYIEVTVLADAKARGIMRKYAVDDDIEKNDEDEWD